MPRRLRTTRWAAVAVPATALLGAAVTAAVTRRWQDAPDLTGGEPLSLPDGEDLVATARDGTALAVRIAGPPDGPTVVLIHGWTNERRVWGAVATRLVAQGCRVVLYDQRGHGASDSGAAGLTMAALGEDLAAVLEAVDARDAVVVGHSMGGMAAQVLAANHTQVLTERAAELVLVASACDRVKNHRVRHLLVDRPVADLAVGVSPIGRWLVRHAVGPVAAIAHLDAVRDMFVATAPQIRGGLRTAMYGLDLSEQLRSVSVPVTVVAAAHDRVLPASRSRRIAELIPGARLHTLDAGHMLPWEAVDDLTEILTDLAVRRSRQAVA